jgi:transglutaminase-like putative cysteine protease
MPARPLRSFTKKLHLCFFYYVNLLFCAGIISTMSLTAYRLLALLLLLPFSYTHAQHSRPQLQKEPAWITSNPISYTNEQLDADAEDGVVDVVYEKQISLETQSVYIKRALKLLSEAGVQNNSEISINYDPAYQQLVFHKINLIRNGRVIDKLQLSKIKTVQQEQDLNSFIYDGSLTAVLFLEDVQKGDALEYSYTLKGFNPVFGGKYSTVLDVGFSVPVYQIYYKLLVPAGRQLAVKNSKTDIKPTLTKAADETQFEWRVTNVPALHTEDNLPAWYDPYPVIRVSEFQSWKEVNDWARALFPFNTPISQTLRAKVQELQRTSTSVEGQVQAALRFVQDDIRYLGIEMGVNSHKPHTPDQIIKQRFGDCKDKSYLLCILLRALGVQANPVLINTTAANTISEWLPAPTVFDHTTVQVLLNNRTYWFDPTISFQRGPLDAISYPGYGTGLVISDTTTWLSNIPPQDKGRMTIKEIFNIADMTGRAQLKVITSCTGSYADNIRNDFKSTSNYELRKTYTEYYAAYFKNIKADSLSASDNETTGVFTTTEYYTLDSIWGTFRSMQEASFEPYVINGLLKKPKGTGRTMPFAFRFPARYTEEIQINLPEAWNINHSEHSSESSVFKIKADYSCTGKQVMLKYDYDALKDHIMPDEMKAYLRELKHAEDGLAYRLTSSNQESNVTYTNASTSYYPSLYLALGLCVFITYMVRKRQQSR